MLVFDKATKRRKDENGFLHVDESHISKETVNGYLGSEIPGWQELGLKPDKIYQCYRKGSELAAGSDTFNGLPILWGHKAESAEEPQKKDRIGSMGTDAKFKKPYLDNSLIFTDKKAIDAIEKGERVELSCSYRWKPVVQSGAFDGKAYDIIMTEIRGNHLGLVEEGRAGGDVMVHDEKPKDKGMSIKENVSKLVATLTGFLASDGAEAKEENIIEKIDEAVEEFKEVHKEEKKEMAKELEAMDSEGMKKAFDKMSKDEKEKFLEMIGKKKDKADDEETETKDSEKAEDMEAEDEETKDCKDEKKADDEEEEKADDEEKAEDSVETLKSHFKTLTTAADDVRPIVGNLDALSFDSASDIYKKALELQKVDTSNQPPEAFKGMFAVHKANVSSKRPELAVDSVTSTKKTGAFAGLNNVKIK